MNKEKKGTMFILMLILIVLLFALGIFLFKENKTSNLEKDFSGFAKDYFNNYMSIGTGANAYKVSLKMLKETNDEGLTDYDLKKFNSCNESKTYAMVSFDYKTGKATKAEITLNCKK